MIDALETTTKHQPVFVSASLHKSLDGTRMFNYAQWQSQADWQAFTKDPQNKVLGEKIKQVGIESVEGHSYQVQRVIESSNI